MKQFQQDILEVLQEKFQEDYLETALLTDDPQRPLELRVSIPSLGKINHTALGQLFFVDAGAQAPDAANPFTVLNICFTLFTEIPQENMEELGRACLWVNPSLLVGAMGVLRESDMLYLKSSLVIRRSYTPEVFLQMIADAYSSMVGISHSLIDGMALVAQGMATLPEVVEQGYFQ